MRGPVIDQGPGAIQAPGAFVEGYRDRALYREGPPYILEPDEDQKADWTETPVGTAWSAVRDGVRQPAVPPLTSHISTATNDASCVLRLTSFLPVGNEVVTSVRVWLYCETPAGRDFTLTLLEVSGILTRLTVPAGTAAGWESIAYVGQLSQTQLDGLRIAADAGTGTGTVTVYSIYAEVRISTDRWYAADAKVMYNRDPQTGLSLAAGWMGTDVWASVDLGAGRSMFLGGDTGWATAAQQQGPFGGNPNGAPGGNQMFIRNSVVLFTSYDLDTGPNPVGYVGFHDDGTPTAYFPNVVVNDQPYHRWPLGAMLIDDRIMVTGNLIQNRPGGSLLDYGPWFACMLSNIDDTPDNWELIELPMLDEGIRYKMEFDGFGGGVQHTYPLDSMGVDAGDGYVYWWGSGPGYDRCVYRLDRTRAKNGHIHGGEWWDGNTGWWRDRQHPIATHMKGEMLRKRIGGAFGFRQFGGPNGNASIAGTAHRRATDGKWQFTAVFSVPLEGEAPVTIADAMTPGSELVPFPTFTKRVELDPEDYFVYAAASHPQLTWAGKGPNDQAWSHASNSTFETGVESISNYGFPRFYRVTSVES